MFKYKTYNSHFSLKYEWSQINGPEIKLSFKKMSILFLHYHGRCLNVCLNRILNKIFRDSNKFWHHIFLKANRWERASFFEWYEGLQNNFGDGNYFVFWQLIFKMPVAKMKGNVCFFLNCVWRNMTKINLICLKLAV